MIDGYPPQDSEAGPLTCVAEHYSDLGLQTPNGRLIAAEEIPAEFSRLLVHQQGMTRTLESIYHQVINLKVLNSIILNGMLTRQVLLLLCESETPAALALVRIHLARFPDAARHMILEQSTPLGRIFQLSELTHYYHSHQYFTISVDFTLELYKGNSQLYGRRVQISDPTEHKALADVVEIILPVS
ncbi:MAG: hypothetical protein J2P41_19165 [Blastocatellia bacterium]|nr:hypothetical protein [Blastocatellia bacterium]